MSETSEEKVEQLKITVVHLDLGQGGAERQTIDECTALKQLGHCVRIATTHWDPLRCFDETKDLSDEGLGTCIDVYGDWIPRHVGGRFHALMSLIRMSYCSLRVALTLATHKRQQQTSEHVIFVDQVSGILPLLKALTGAKLVFYCHFPDKLVAASLLRDDSRMGVFASLYRGAVDSVERMAMSCADAVLYNSQFTKRTTLELWPELESSVGVQRVVYPCIQLRDDSAKDSESKDDDTAVSCRVECDGPMFVSINRFEPKKDVELAIYAFAHLKPADDDKGEDAPRYSDEPVHLVLAGGFDERLAENKEYLCELRDICRKYKLVSETIKEYPAIGSDTKAPTTLVLNSEASVHFVLAFPDWVKTALLTSDKCLAVLYTPQNEHFGIVPLEAMAAGKPVVASRSGGPTESVVHESTGLLCATRRANEWANNMLSLLQNPALAQKMGAAGRQRVADRFSLPQLKQQLAAALDHLRKDESLPLTTQSYVLAFSLLLLLSLVLPLIGATSLLFLGMGC